MDPASFGRRLADRASLAAIPVADDIHEALAAYFDLLSRWNRTINLTSLSTDTDEAIDRLLLEPLAAAPLLPRGAALMDLGSGGGSPAIPLALALNASRLIMVESRGRKAAFLREAARVTGVTAVVHEGRFEDLSARRGYREEVDIVSMRAVRMDESALTTATTFLKPSGTLALFVASGSDIPRVGGLVWEDRHFLIGNADLVRCGRIVPRGTME